MLSRGTWISERWRTGSGVEDTDLRHHGIGDDRAAAVERDGQTIRKPEPAKRVDGRAATEVDHEHHAVLVAPNPRRCAVRRDRDAFRLRGHVDDAGALARQRVQYADGAIGDVARHHPRAIGGKAEHVRYAPVGGQRTAGFAIAEVHEKHGTVPLCRHGENRITRQKRHPMRPLVLVQVDGARDLVADDVDHGDAVPRLAAHTVVTDRRPSSIVRDRHLVRTLASWQSGEHAACGRIEHRCRVVVHVARDDRPDRPVHALRDCDARRHEGNGTGKHA